MPDEATSLVNLSRNFLRATKGPDVSSIPKNTFSMTERAGTRDNSCAIIVIQC